ncbi:MAG: redox-regulated ATPase YchF [Limnochordales bacterium]|nr:redox-regulated ATPase YchF [Limnochordales bacterium]
MRIGIVGLPQVGKTSVFQALTGSTAGVGVAPVPDPRVDRLAAMFNPRKTTYAQLELVDLPSYPLSGGPAGTPAGGKTVEQARRAFLEAVRDVDALIQVVRAFDNPAVPPPLGSINPAREFATLQEEFQLSDYQVLQNRLERLAKTGRGRTGNPASARSEAELLERCSACLEEGKPLRTLSLAAEEEKLLRGFDLFTFRPVILVVNLDEDEWRRGKYTGQEVLEALAAAQHLPVLPICGRLEQEIAELPPEEREAFAHELGIEETGIARLARTTYAHLGLISFFTVGEDEVKAWTIRRGMSAREAAGRIHSDIARGFIRAEVVTYADLMACGSLAAARDKGLLRLEGKDYVMQDGDIVNFRFHV